MNKKKVDWKIVCVALLCLTGLECFAISQGINGTILTIVVAVIAGIAGYVIPSPMTLK